jgi:hypothetical protein
MYNTVTSSSHMRPSSAIPWKKDVLHSDNLADSFENPLFADVSNLSQPTGHSTVAGGSEVQSPARNPLFEGHATGRRLGSSGSVIRFASQHDGEPDASGGNTRTPGVYMTILKYHFPFELLMSLMSRLQNA